LRGEGWGGGEQTVTENDNRVTIAQNLRKRSTDTERLLWKYLRAKQIAGFKFRRQHPIGAYVVDFVCLERHLIIEVDGGQHAEEKEKDCKRDKWLQDEGYVVLRFWNSEVLKNIEAVLAVIMKHCLNHPPPTPPLKGGVKDPAV
jgi:very-short-patch-repair endonuclease